MRLHRTLPLLSLCVWLSSCLPSVTMPDLITAARTGDLDRMESLLKAGADPNLRAGVNDWTVLLHAIHKNQEGSVRVLLAYGADVDALGGGTTPLVMAAGYGYAGIVRTLLKAGADPNITLADGSNALTAAVGGVPDIDRFTVGRCQTETVQTLLDAAPTLRLMNNFRGNAALRIAKFAHCWDVVQLVRIQP